MLSPDHLQVLLHTVGLTDPRQKESYRNRFVCGDGCTDLPILLALCEQGLMVELPRTRVPTFLGSTDRLFMATERGLAVANKERPKLSKTKRRYRAFLDARDPYPDLTFKDFLTHPYFKNSRENP